MMTVSIEWIGIIMRGIAARMRVRGAGGELLVAGFENGLIFESQGELPAQPPRVCENPTARSQRCRL